MTDTDTPSQRFALRRLTSFRLRTVLIAITVLAVWLGLHMNSVRKQRASVEAVLRHGGAVCYDYQLEHVRSGNRPADAESAVPAWLLRAIGRDHFHDVVWVATKGHGYLSELKDPEVRKQGAAVASADLLSRMDGFSELQALTLFGTHAGVSGLEYAGRQKHLQSLHISGNAKLTGEGVDHLAKLGELRYVSIRFAQIDEGFLRGLGRLRNLSGIQIMSSEFTGDDLRHLKGLRQLRELTFAATGDSIKDSDLAHLEHLPGLESLAFFRTNISDEGFRHIAKLDHLRSLTVNGAAISETGFEHIAELDNLRFLYLQDALTTDSCVRQVAGLKNLRGLALNVSSRETARWLQQQLPNCSIRFSIAARAARHSPPDPLFLKQQRMPIMQN